MDKTRMKHQRKCLGCGEIFEPGQKVRLIGDIIYHEDCIHPITATVLDDGLLLWNDGSNEISDTYKVGIKKMER